MDTHKSASAESLDPSESLILSSARQMRFGEIRIVIHDSKIVQVDRIEKVRLPNAARAVPDKR